MILQWVLYLISAFFVGSGIAHIIIFIIEPNVMSIVIIFVSPFLGAFFGMSGIVAGTKESKYDD